MNNQYSKLEMIGAVREYLIKKGFLVVSEYDPAFEPARVPIFAYKENDDERQEVFVDIITERSIETKAYFPDRVFNRVIDGSSGLQINKANSSQFFRHYFPGANVYWAIPDYVDRDGEFAEFRRNCRRQNIGLLQVKRKLEKQQFTVRELLGPIPLIDERAEELERGLRLTKSKRDRLSKLIGKWSQEDLSYLVFYPEPRYLAADISTRDKEYSISRELINKMSLLKNISYGDILADFSKNYNRRAEDDYSIALDITQRLWGKYDVQFPKIQADFELILKRDPKYRDHFLHSFQVFLFGVYVIDGLYLKGLWNSSFGTESGRRIEDAWLFAATYHDYNYMIQKFDDWTKAFFRSALHIELESNPARLDLGEPYVNHGYMLKTKVLTESFGVSVDDVVLSFLYDRILNRKNHGLLSGLSLLKYLEKSNCNTLSAESRAVACRAICLHDMDIWLHMAGKAEAKKEDPFGDAFNRKQLLRTLSLEADPISFMLLLSDSLQEQGREKVADESKAELESLDFRGGRLYVEITYKGSEADRIFNEKIGELNTVCSFLDGRRKFNIRVRNVNSDQSHDFNV